MIRPCREKRDGGYTIIELVITMAILMIVLGVALDFLNVVTRNQGRASADLQKENDARITLRTMTEDIRSAFDVLPLSNAPSCPAGSTYASCFSFDVIHSSSEASPTCPYSVISYSLSGGNLLEDRTDFSSSGGGGCTTAVTTTGKKLISGLQTTSPLFTYYDKSGTPVAAGSVVAGSMPSTNVGSVLVTIVAQYNPTAASLRMTSLAAVRNNR